MATYEFVCLHCDKHFEITVPGFLKDEERVCPACGSTEIRQKFSSFLRNIATSGGGCSPVRGSGFG